jgi:ribosomal protein S18 acetylase RimI-like enzyme
VREHAASILAWYGLKPVMTATGMVADRLVEPVRPLPPLDLRPVRDAWGRRAVADINSTCYDVPRDIGREAFDVDTMFGPDTRGFVACHDGVPVSSAAVQRVDGTAYISLVATLPGHRRLSAAESTLRRALAEAREAWGLERTALHATELGLPVYLRMGYRPVTRFHMYMAPAPGTH